MRPALHHVLNKKHNTPFNSFIILFIFFPAKGDKTCASNDMRKRRVPLRGQLRPGWGITGLTVGYVE